MAYTHDTSFIYLAYASDVLGGRADAARRAALLEGSPFERAVELDGTLQDAAAFPRLAAAAYAAEREREYLVIPLAARASRDAAVCVVGAAVNACVRAAGRRDVEPALRARAAVLAAAYAAALRVDRGYYTPSPSSVFEDAGIDWIDHYRAWQKIVAKTQRVEGKDWYSNVAPDDALGYAILHAASAVVHLDWYLDSVADGKPDTYRGQSQAGVDAGYVANALTFFTHNARPVADLLRVARLCAPPERVRAALRAAMRRTAP